MHKFNFVRIFTRQPPPQLPRIPPSAFLISFISFAYYLFAAFSFTSIKSQNEVALSKKFIIL